MFRLPSTPNPFTAARILILPLLWVFAMLNWQPALALGLALAALTDVLDGRLAKRYPQYADARFDSLADKLLTFSVIAWVIILKPQLIIGHWLLLLGAALIFSLSLFIGWRRHGRLTTLHTYLGKAGGLFQAVFVVHAFFTAGYSLILFYMAVSIFILAAIEEFFIQLVYPEIDEEVVHSIIPYLLNREVAIGEKKNS
jgi:phosphatidylglycerophosphate synthase